MFWSDMPPDWFVRLNSHTEGGVMMGIAEAISAALFCFSMVFALLGSLYGLVKLSTGVIRIIDGKK